MQLNRLEIVGHHVWLRPQASVSLGEVHADSGALQHRSSAIVDHCRHSVERVNKLDVPLPLVGLIHYRNPAVTGRSTTPATGERVWEQRGGRFVADEMRQSRHRRSWRRVTSSRHQLRCIYRGHGQRRLARLRRCLLVGVTSAAGEDVDRW